MSRLESFIRRMSAQRDILDSLPACLEPLPGLVLEFGLGSARTYDHLRLRFPGRRVVAFESVLVPGFACRVPASDLVLGDLRDTAGGFPSGCAALIHADIETGDPGQDATLADWLPAICARLLVPGGFAASGAALPHPELRPQATPASVPAGRYHLVRRT